MPKLPKDFAALVYVHLGLLAAAFGAAWFVHTQSTVLPLMDEWDLLREWLETDTTWHFIWKHHNEHRFPLSKMIWLGALKATGFNFAAPQYVTFALLYSTALLLIWTARCLRGRSHPIDLLFAALLLHFGHGFNLQMGYQVGFVLFAYCAAGWLWCAGRLAQGGGTGWAVASTIYAALLIPCGGFGLLFTPVVAFWLVYLARRARTMGKPALRWYCFALTALVIAYSGWIAATMRMPDASSGGTSPLEKPGEFLTAVVGYLACSLGTWPVREGSEPWFIIAVAIPVAVAYAVGFRTVTLRLDELDPRRVLFVAILLVMVGTVLVGAASAKARGGGLAERYATASAVGLAAVLLGFIGTVPLRPSKWVNLAGSVGALALSAGLLYANYNPGLNLAYQMRETIHGLNRDIRAGQSPMFIAGRHGGTPGVLVGELLSYDLSALRTSGIPPFQLMTADPAYHTEALPALPKTDWHYPEADYEAHKPAPEMALPDPPAGVIGLRLRVTTVKFSGWQRLALRWIDAKTGIAHEWVAFPHLHSVPLSITFMLTGTPTKVRLVAFSPIQEIIIDSADDPPTPGWSPAVWLIGEGNR